MSKKLLVVAALAMLTAGAVGWSSPSADNSLPAAGLCDRFENGQRLTDWSFTGDWIVVNDPLDPGDPNDRPNPFNGTLTVSETNSVGMPVTALLGVGAGDWRDYAADLDIRYGPTQNQVSPYNMDYGLRVYWHYASRLNYVVFEIFRGNRPWWEPFDTRLVVYRNGLPVKRALGARLDRQGNFHLRLIADQGLYSVLVDEEVWIKLPFPADRQAYGGVGFKFAPLSQVRAFSRLYFDNVCLTPLRPPAETAPACGNGQPNL